MGGNGAGATVECDGAQKKSAISVFAEASGMEVERVGRGEVYRLLRNGEAGEAGTNHRTLHGSLGYCAPSVTSVDALSHVSEI